MARFKLELKGNKALARSLSKMSSEAREMVGYEIETSLEHIEAQAKTTVSSIADDKGFLLGSIVAQPDRANLRGQVIVGKHYGPYVEFGTGGRVNVPAGLESYAMQFKGKGIKQVNLPPRPFLFPAFYAETPKLIKRINKGLKDWK